MTDKSLDGGHITIRKGACRPDLETTPINAGDHAEPMCMEFVHARACLNAIAMPLAFFAEASEKTLTTLAEAEEILANLQVRMSCETPLQTAYERSHPKT